MWVILSNKCVINISPIIGHYRCQYFVLRHGTISVLMNHLHAYSHLWQKPFSYLVLVSIHRPSLRGHQMSCLLTTFLCGGGDGCMKVMGYGQKSQERKELAAYHESTDRIMGTDDKCEQQQILFETCRIVRSERWRSYRAVIIVDWKLALFDISNQNWCFCSML